MKTAELTLAKRGVLTLPKEIRETYRLAPGDPMTLLDLGGVFVISPHRSELGAVADQLAQSLAAKGENLTSMLKVVREEREQYGKKR